MEFLFISDILIVLKIKLLIDLNKQWICSFSLILVNKNIEFVLVGLWCLFSSFVDIYSLNLKLSIFCLIWKILSSRVIKWRIGSNGNPIWILFCFVGFKQNINNNWGGNFFIWFLFVNFLKLVELSIDFQYLSNYNIGLIRWFSEIWTNYTVWIKVFSKLKCHKHIKFNAANIKGIIFFTKFKMCLFYTKMNN